MGGVATDLDARTSLAGLFAAGEAACTGVHGANRLASNSLLEGLVFGARAGAAMAAWDGAAWPERDAPIDSGSTARTHAPALPITEPALRDVMWQHAGIFRSGEGLAEARRALEPAWQAVVAGLGDPDAIDADRWRLTSLITTARLVTSAAEWRHESRGAHWRADFPQRDDLHWLRHWSDHFPQR
jgi:L-aspartate oxidase